MEGQIEKEREGERDDERHTETEKAFYIFYDA